MPNRGYVSAAESAAVKQRFLMELVKHGRVVSAAIAVDRTFQWAYERRREDPQFAADWDDAVAIADDRIDGQIWDWAFTPERVQAISSGKWVHDDNGNPVWIEQRDHEAMKLLARSRMSKYRTAYRDVTVHGDVNHNIIPSHSNMEFVTQLQRQVGDNPDAIAAISAALLAMSGHTVDALPALLTSSNSH